MASWNGMDSDGPRYYQQSMMYPNQYVYPPHEYYPQDSYQNNVSQSYWYESQSQHSSEQPQSSSNLTPQSREFIPTMVYQSNSTPSPNSEWSGNDGSSNEGVGGGGGLTEQEGGEVRGQGAKPRQAKQFYKRWVQNNTNSGINRLYRHSNYQTRNRFRGGGVGGGSESNGGMVESGLVGGSKDNGGDKNMKLEGRRKLLAEAASLLADQHPSALPRRDRGQPKSGRDGGKPKNWKERHNLNPEEEGSSVQLDRRSYRESGYKDGERSVEYPEHNRKEIGGGNRQWRNNDGKQRPLRQWQESLNLNKTGKGGSVSASNVCQRERLSEQLTNGTLECLVCCERVRAQDQTWCCAECRHVLHLRCAARWAQASSTPHDAWHCPVCRHPSDRVPSQYWCMCGAVEKPVWDRGSGLVPHTCGGHCSRTYPTCPHPCPLSCHPGPCPPCRANVPRGCGCGRTTTWVQCGSSVMLVCPEKCNKLRSCQVHQCGEQCHEGDCPPCSLEVPQVCYCKRETRLVPCSANIGEFSCGVVCGQRLECGEHDCGETCHVGDCGSCPLSPDVITTCPCGRKPTERTRCTDEVVTCGAECRRAHTLCGHPCPQQCHIGPCPPCALTSRVTCRCGATTEQLPCTSEEFLCGRRCSKKRLCGKHKCNLVCCIEVEHVCPLPCNKTLSCGRHKCDQLCHRGLCQPCSAVSFEELSCECGAEVILPPVACGTKPPECSVPCTRAHSCTHPPMHSCHSAPDCPPCTVLTSRRCYGGHETRRTMPCGLSPESFSCGRPCLRPLPNCSHKCDELCHGGECKLPCRQACEVRRRSCGHPCALPCHTPEPCPPSPCLALVKVTCPCTRRSLQRSCNDNSSEYKRLATSLLASKMADVQLGLSIDADIKANLSKMGLKTLECNDECKLQERNMRLAIGLQIVNPDLSSKLNPRYSDSMRVWAKKDPRLVQMIHDKLTHLVQLAKESKQKSRSYSFDPMNREKRQLVHEYCKHFGVESQAYDKEPKRNIVATAIKGQCWLPSYSLLEVLQRENGQRKVPLPTLRKVSIKDTQMKPLQRGSSTLATPREEIPEESNGKPATKQEAPSPIDYFEYNN